MDHLSPNSILRLEMRAGESIRIGDSVVLRLEQKTGRVARFTIDAPRSVPIKQQRSENQNDANKVLLTQENQ